MNNVVRFVLYKDFLEYYSKKICPTFCEIDVCLKVGDVVELDKVALLLEISKCEIRDIMEAHNMSAITKENFLKIMLAGTSYICQLFKREMECGCPVLYTPWQVAYIYNLDAYIVSDIFEFLEVEEVTAGALPDVFGMIQLQG